MRLTQTIEARQQQTQRIDPRQILASEILAWTTPELEAAVEREMAENPALETRDGEPLAGLMPPSYDGYAAASMLNANFRTASALGPMFDGGANNGAAVSSSGATLPASAPNGLTLSNFTMSSGGVDDDNPLDRVAGRRSLRDHLRDQVGQVCGNGVNGLVRPDLVRYLIECVDDRGYLCADLLEVAETFRAAPAEVENAVHALQAMEPAGVGARDLRECLLLQAEYLEQTGEAHPFALRILTQCWDDLAARREERIAVRLRINLPEARVALAFLQTALTPYPGSAFRPSGSGKNNGQNGAPAIRPDLVFHRVEAGFMIEMPRDFEEVLAVAPLWKKLSDKPDAGADEAMRRYIRDHVDRAQAFLTGVSRRGRTLRAIAQALVRYQQGFLETGNRAFLHPLTRQSLAEELSLDESVISRAVADKWVQLPSGEVVPLDAFFGNAHAVREALANLIASENPSCPYSDDEIADELTAQGFPLARRTVAKYRSLEKILPARLRKRSPNAALAA